MFIFRLWSKNMSQIQWQNVLAKLLAFGYTNIASVYKCTQMRDHLKLAVVILKHYSAELSVACGTLKRRRIGLSRRPGPKMYERYKRYIYEEHAFLVLVRSRH